MRHYVIFSAVALSVGAISIPAEVDAQSWRSRAVRHEIRKEIRRDHRRDKRRNTIIGAGIGMIGGAVLSGGDPWATVAGAAGGGLVGNLATQRPRYRLRHRDWRD